tara:strand:+ start:589 stop:738 length:150 start_codon:yes stop_codon:yes gene_type:complete
MSGITTKNRRKMCKKSKKVLVASKYLRGIIKTENRRKHPKATAKSCLQK